MRRSLSIFVLMVLAAATTRGQQVRDSFEQWEERSGRMQPVGWSLNLGSGEAEMPYRGDRALSVWTWYCSSSGSAILGLVNPEAGSACHTCYDKYGIPVSFKPVAISGYYRLVPGPAGDDGQDSAMVGVLLKKYNPSRGTYDTVGIAEHFLKVTQDYTPFTVSIKDLAPGIMPDSIAMVFVSSVTGTCDCATTGECYFLSVDDISFDAASGVSYTVGGHVRQSRVYPNPARGTMRIEWGRSLSRPHRLRVYAISGEVIRTMEGLTGTEITLDVKGLPAGEYLFDLADGGAIAAQGRFVVE